MPMDFTHLHDRLNGKRPPGDDYEVNAAALTAAIETFQMVRLAQDETLSDKQRQTSTQVCLTLIPGLNAEAYMDAPLALQEEAISDKMKEIWESAKVWAGKLWDGLTGVFKKAEEVYDDAMDKLDRRLSGEYVEVNFPIKESFAALKKVPGMIKDLAKKAKAALTSEEAVKAYEKAIADLKETIKGIGTVAKKVWKLPISEAKSGLNVTQSMLHVLTGDIDKAGKTWEEAMIGEIGGKSTLGWTKEAYMSISKSIADLWKTFADKSTAIAKAIK